jgi:hypothetical protein
VIYSDSSGGFWVVFLWALRILNRSGDRCLQLPQQGQDEEMLLPHLDIVEGPKPMEGVIFRLLLGGFSSTNVALSCPTIFLLSMVMRLKLSHCCDHGY